MRPDPETERRESGGTTRLDDETLRTLPDYPLPPEWKVCPDWLLEIARRVSRAVGSPDVMTRYRRMREQWTAEHNQRSPKTPVALLPCPATMTIAHKYTTLAAIHDVVLKGTPGFAPIVPPQVVSPQDVAFWMLFDEVRQLGEGDRVEINAILADVDADVSGLIHPLYAPARTDGRWPLRPFDPGCRESFEDSAADKAAVIAAVRDNALKNWDGQNMVALREALRNMGRTPEELRAMTWPDIRHACDTRPVAIGQSVTTAVTDSRTATPGSGDAPAGPQTIQVDAAVPAGIQRLPNLMQHDKQAWQLSLLHGMTQEKVAEQLSREHGKKYTQGEVSRMIRRAKQHAEASGLAAMVTGKAERPKTVDPAALELGRRVDRRKPRPSDLARAENDRD
ncbi:hypothetical protein RAS1_03570 [Phycisphaerae bacterium RAS1]|nr:hypothetical protein RAS1_03570 [Phycisphaerae bacterium RAS1]